MTSKATPRSALIACSDEWMCRTLQSLFEEKGYSATRASSGKDALKGARGNGFDVVLLDESITELRAVDVCAALRDDPLFDHATPIVITSSAHSTQRSRIAAYAAGAWEYCTQPLDGEALFLKLATFLRSRDGLGGSESRRVTDPESGLYTGYGLEQVSEQLSARALRRHEPFACVAFSAQRGDREVVNDHSLSSDGGFADVVKIVRRQSRKSDIIAQTGPSRLAILAPDTDAVGARNLVSRLQKAFDQTSGFKPSQKGMQLRIGYCALPDFAEARVELKELVNRAQSALEHTSEIKDGPPVLDFDDLPKARQ